MKKIVLFNHKGGVSKTTTTFHLGWMVARMNHKVLLVDADPQCNLTSLMLMSEFDSFYENEETKNNNIMSGVRPAFAGEPEPIKPIKCVSTKRNPNLFLLPGHMNLSEYDAPLNFALNSTQSILTLQNLPGAFNDLIVKTAESVGADFVFIDLNPGLSAINQNVFLLSDAFIIPANPDTFSLMALKSLSTILPRWVHWKNNNIKYFENSAYPLPEGTPKFIGEIPQRFNIRNGAPTAPFKIKLQELADTTLEIFVPAIQHNNMMYEREKYIDSGININSYFLDEIKDFQSLSPRSLNTCVPVFELTDEEIGTTGTVLDGQRRNREEFKSLYEHIANQIIKVTA